MAPFFVPPATGYNGTMKRLLPLIPLLFSSALIAGPVEDGVAAFRAGEHQRAHELWLPAAREGDAQARYNLALLYANGWGVPRHPRTAFELYKAAAQQGHLESQYNLGLAYRQGLGVVRSNLDAAHWWTQAAERGHPRARFNLGLMYAQGLGVGKDTDKALGLWELSARSGYAKAREALAQVLESGKMGFPRDPARASYWRAPAKP